MGHTLNRLTSIAYRNGWDIKPLTFSNGDNGGFIAVRDAKAVTVSANRVGRIVDVKHSDQPFTNVLCDRAGVAAQWLRQE